MTTSPLDRRTFVAGGASLIAGGLVASRFAKAQTPDGTPDASPAASPIALPEGPLGTAIAWLQAALNQPGGPTEQDVLATFSPVYLQSMSASDVAALIADFADMGVEWTIQTDSMIMTMDFPPSNASFFITEPGGLRLQGGISIDRDTGLIGGFTLTSANDAATPVG